MNAQSIYVRTVARLSSGRVRAGGAVEQGIVAKCLGPESDVLGVYTDADGEVSLIFSSTGLAILGTPVSAIRYSDIRQVRLPEMEASKLTQKELRIALGDGTSRTVEIDGGTSSTRDVFEVCRFLMRASGTT